GLGLDPERSNLTSRTKFFDNVLNYSYSGVKKPALKATCSDRICKLSVPKLISAEYLDAKPLPAPVPQSALRVKSTSRIQELARPKYDIATFGMK
ncbi:unnamed protein product, partial [Didymodactylos carnosus]